jgi:proteasome lid subunit RPN8/RPN11
MMFTTPLPENAPMSPAMPEAWTDAVAEAAKVHTAEVYPHEAAGIVVGGEYQRLDNLSLTPGNDIALGDDDLVKVAQAELFFHSHPDGLGCPSESDMRYQAQLAIPFVVMVWPLYDVFWFGDQLAPAPLIGRGFRHGVHDCYSLLRDYYGTVRNDPIIDQPRDWNWWDPRRPNGGRLDLYRDYFDKAGFRKISVAEATEPGDGLIMAFNFTVPMHGMVVWDRDMLLHHPAGMRPVDPTRLSVLVPRSRFLRHASFALRRK